ncbi:penicillin-binding transpeptidase domain-containing protein [Pauljensenia sp. 20925_1_34]|jgi:penicillin binding protein transpeptidase domain protein|uniref:peptidoglycan D,D-transpeptidase FtsI family protein n=1 Tax=Pauljensenia sp. 20925_1_34 TaxID=3003674 RepID=UPI00352E4961
MNAQIRKIFVVVLIMFAMLGLAVTNTQFISAPSLNADPRNVRTNLHAAEIDRGPIIVEKTAIASSELDDDNHYTRVYDQGSLYVSATGYFSSVGYGSTGIEAAQENVLDGQSQTLLGQRLRNLLTGEKRQGGGVELTLRASMQEAAAAALGDRKGAVVALDAKTGAILALYSSPSFDPNALASRDAGEVQDAYATLDADPKNPMLNRTISERYAPGSTFKVLTAIALIENGIANPDTRMDSPVSTTLPGTNTEVSNIESSTCGDGKPTLTEAFARSCNTTFVLASEKLTTQQLTDVTKRFGFGHEQEIPLTVIPSVFPADADSAQLAMSSIGQYTVQATPMQMAQVAQTIANGGQMMSPYLIKQIVDADNQTIRKTKATEAGRPISADTASKVTGMMQAVVSQPYGSGTPMALPNVSVAAKTGTAETGDGDRANAWAIGFAPADNPQIAFAVIVEGDETNPTPHGGDVAGPVAKAVLEAGLQ